MIIRSSTRPMIRYTSQIRPGLTSALMAVVAGSREARVAAIPDMGTAS
jgi:hypothetical protein